MRASRQFLLRMVAALLLVFAIPSPALAEVACAVENATHVVTAADHAAAPADESSDDEQADPGAGHCSFSHSHCGGVASNGGSDLLLAATGLRPPVRTAAPVPSPAPAGPDRPPRI